MNENNVNVQHIPQHVKIYMKRIKSGDILKTLSCTPGTEHDITYQKLYKINIVKKFE